MARTPELLCTASPLVCLISQGPSLRWDVPSWSKANRYRERTVGERFLAQDARMERLACFICRWQRKGGCEVDGHSPGAGSLASGSAS